MDFEKLGAFYLGKEYDLAKGRLLDNLVMYDARDLTTHGVCVGMTGSGKTGLCILLLEEAAIDHVPAIIIDPKGDITNLLLTFPDLRPQDFAPWINVDDARRKGLSPEEFAAKQAELWRSGLAEWGQDGARIQMLRDSADFVIYTPGSDAGVPVSILHSFAVPPLSWETDAELLRERIQGTVSALLGLVGIDADPVRSREHILLSNIFEHFWRQGEDLDLAKIILAIQNPPMRQLGVFDIDTFFPQKDRLGLAMSLNNLIAAPAFQSWLHGQPLDIAGFLATPTGKPRHSIFYIAHLSDAERMFFVTMLLNQVITWMRTQPGTTSLRALVYMDEIFGFFPPVANPPSKQPMLTLLKQARAFGVGVLLTTQNPVDLDYKGLTNAGTWFIGRLQTERDKARVLEGLESASSQAGQSLDRAAFDRIISALGQRVFLLHTVHEDAPVVFQTRWALSYLRGPLTRDQIRRLKGDRMPEQVGAPAAAAAAAPAAPATAPVAVPVPGSSALLHVPPSLATGFQQAFIPVQKGPSAAVSEIEQREGGPVEVVERRLLYRPSILGLGRVHYVDARRGIDHHEQVALLAEPPRGAGVVAWERGRVLELTPHELTDQPEPDALFEPLPESIATVTAFNALKKDLTDYWYYNQSLTLFHSPLLKAYSQPGESERDFRTRLQQTAREQRDAEVDKISQKYAQRLATLKERLRRYEATLARKEADAAARQRETLVSVGESVVGLFMGRRATRVASTALSKHRQAQLKKIEVEEAEENVEAVRREIQELEEALQKETEAVRERWEQALVSFEEVPIKPRRSDVEVDLFALGWAPHWLITSKSRSGETRSQVVPAF
jgi:hypothetical protein